MINRLYLYISMILLLIGISHAYTNTTWNPDGFTNPGNAFDGNVGTFASNGAVTSTFGVTFDELIFISQIGTYSQITSSGTGSRSLEYTTDGSTWNSLYDLVTVGEIIDNTTFTTQFFKGIRIKFTNPSQPIRVMTFNWTSPVNYTFTDLGYATSVGEQTTTYFSLNITTWNYTIQPGTNPNATLYYNKTLYPMNITTQNSTFVSFTTNLMTPDVTQNTNINFNITYFINNLASNTSTYTQSVTLLNGFNFSAVKCANPQYNFTLMDEDNFTILTADTIDYNFYYGVNNGTTLRSYGRLLSTSNLYICMNDTISTLWNIGYGEIVYKKSGWVDRRYYIFNGTQVYNATITNISLYDLNNNFQTSFQLTVESTSQSALSNYYTTLVRWYPNLNQYNVVDMGLTDETGSTVIHVRAEDIDYRLGVYYNNGTLLYLANPVRMVCLTSPCSYTLKVTPSNVDYSSLLNIQYTFTFNYTTNIWSFTYSDPSQRTSTMNLSVYSMSGNNVYIICSNLVTGYTGAVTCNTSGYTGTLKGEVQRTASPSKILDQIIATVTTSAFQSDTGLFLSIFAGIFVVFIGVFVSPVAGIVMSILAFIPALYFGSINWAIMGGICVMGLLVLHMMKRTG